MTFCKSYLIAASRMGPNSSSEERCGSGRGYTNRSNVVITSHDSVTGMTGLTSSVSGDEGCGRVNMSWKKGDAAARITL